MYEDVINSIQREIAEKENLIIQIKNFSNLDLNEKIQTMKKCNLRYKRGEMAKLLQNDFKSDFLKNGYARMGVNYFSIYNDNHTFSVGLFNGKIIEIENKEKLLKNISLNQKEFYDLKLKEIDENKNKLVNYKNKKNYKNFIEIAPLLEINNKSRLYFLYKYFFLNRKINLKIKGLNGIKLLYEDNIHKYNKTEDINKEITLKNEEYKKLIEDDLNYFKDKGYYIKYSF